MNYKILFIILTVIAIFGPAMALAIYLGNI